MNTCGFRKFDANGQNRHWRLVLSNGPQPVSPYIMSIRQIWWAIPSFMRWPVAISGWATCIGIAAVEWK